jgi:hypothetical protein
MCSMREQEVGPDISSSTQTSNALAEALQKSSSKPLEVTHVPRAELERRLEENPADARTDLLLGWDTGKGALPYPLLNDVWPEWKPKKALETLLALVA